MADRVGERYEPLAVVARGEESEVLYARDHLSGRLVALQVRHLVSTGELDALVFDSLDLLDVVRHPNLPFVREHFLCDDAYYVVVEWVEGRRLDRILRSDGTPGLPLGVVLDHLQPVAGALEHLHAQKAPVFHRNVRPSNLVLTGDGRVVLVGFGLTPRWGTERLPLDEPAAPASDVYGLAFTAYTLLTGAAPEPGVAPRFSGLSDAEAEGVLRALHRGLDADPSRRPSSPTALLEEIRSGASTLLLVEDEPAAVVEAEPAAVVEAEPETDVEAEPETDVEAEPETDVEAEPETDVE
ncbi:MAG: protein kinase domain-containing protein, partial [Acidimicrobiia bacterium]